jgi:hypothetical protein
MPAAVLSATWVILLMDAGSFASITVLLVAVFCHRWIFAATFFKRDKKGNDLSLFHINEHPVLAVSVFFHHHYTIVLYIAVTNTDKWLTVVVAAIGVKT